MHWKEAGMDAQPWLERLREELARRKLPPLYAERLVSELADHITDSMEDPMSTDAQDLRTIITHQLGSPRDVAASAAKEYRKGHFCGRHPVLSFVLLPIVALPFLWAVGLLVFGVSLKLLGVGGGEPTADQLQLARTVLPYVVSAMVVVPIALAAAVFCWLGHKAGVHWRWPLVACLLLAALSGPTMVDAGLRGAHPRGLLHGTRYRHVSAESPDALGFVSVGFGMSRRPSLSQIVQFALPLAICAFVAYRQTRVHRVSCSSPTHQAAA
jgi:hypothetical protein